MSKLSMNKKAAVAPGRELTADELNQVGGAWAVSDGYYEDPYGGGGSGGYVDPYTGGPSEPQYPYIPYEPEPVPPAEGGGGGGDGGGGGYSDPYNDYPWNDPWWNEPEPFYPYNYPDPSDWPSPIPEYWYNTP